MLDFLLSGPLFHASFAHSFLEWTVPQGSLGRLLCNAVGLEIVILLLLLLLLRRVQHIYCLMKQLLPLLPSIILE